MGSRGSRFDALVASYLLNPGQRAYSLDDLALEYLGERPEAGAEGVAGEDAALEPTARAAAQEADVVLRLAEPVRARLEAEALLPIFDEMELPLVEVLADMERAGVKIDTALLAEHEPDMERQLAALTREIYVLAKGEFNINSPDPAPRDPLRPPGPEEREEDGQDPRRLHRRGGPRGAGPRPRAAAQDPRVPLGAEAQVAPTWTRCPSW